MTGRDGPDLLVAGDDEPPWTLGRRRTRLLVGALAGFALLAGTVEAVSRERAADREAQESAAAADALDIVLGDRSKLPREGPLRHGVFVELINFGPRDVRVLSIDLGPDPRWAVLPDEAGLLRGRSSVVLELLVPCAEDDPVGEGVGRAPVPDAQAEPPRTLELTAELASGRTATTELDLMDDPLADGGNLDPLLRAGLPDLSMPDLSTPDFTGTCA